MEHHSNIVPWQLAADERGAKIRVLPMSESGELELEQLDTLLSKRTRLVAVGHVSNALGTVNAVRDIVTAAHERGIPVLVDGAQAAPHLPIDVQQMGCDFYCISGHKMFGPTGIGVLFGRAELLEAMTPYQGGGDMIRTVSFERTSYAPIPTKFEAGTPNIAGAVGLAAAIDYMSAFDWNAVMAYEDEVLRYAHETIGAVPGVRIIGTAEHKTAVLSFLLEGIHAHDIGTIVDQDGIAIRTGHHCAQPVMDYYGVAATARASFALYNTKDEVDILAAGLRRVQEVLG